jgi:hypothetical protein
MLCRHGEVEHDVVAVSIVDQERERESQARERLSVQARIR